MHTITLGQLTTNLTFAEQEYEKAKKAGAKPQLPGLYAEVRKAREALRVFSYLRKPCITPSGRCLRP